MVHAASVRCFLSLQVRSPLEDIIFIGWSFGSLPAFLAMSHLEMSSTSARMRAAFSFDCRLGSPSTVVSPQMERSLLLHVHVVAASPQGFRLEASCASLVSPLRRGG
eukprot:TRINITY_DN38747_c0_g1_i1.p1 TRINITY_DN38747_c0_g1~~TRINITY_DN38747_c0_g1_i1.p1  ORF type:complete len:107 (+),score=10.81 TRINITY_DN38747_c0_g1_i1:34-354(+)